MTATLGQDRLFPKDVAAHWRISERSARRWLKELEESPDGHKVVGRVGSGKLKGQRYTTLAALARVVPIAGPSPRELHDRMSFLEDQLRAAQRTIEELLRRMVRLER